MLNSNSLSTSMLIVNGIIDVPGDRGSVLGRVIPKTQKMVLDATLLHTQDYKVQTRVK